MMSTEANKFKVKVNGLKIPQIKHNYLWSISVNYVKVWKYHKITVQHSVIFGAECQMMDDVLTVNFRK